MFLTKISTTVCVMALTAAFVLGATPVSRMLGLTSTVHAQSFGPFLDDFEDGSATDGNPVTWADYPAPYNLGTFQVIQGDLVISPATTGPVLPAAPNYREKDVVAVNRVFHDVNVLARVRALTSEPSVVGIGVLDTHLTDGNVGMSVNAALVFDGTRRYLTINNEVNQNFTQLGEMNTPVNHFTDDVNLRVAIAGNQVSFSVWPEGQLEPLVPQMRRTILSSFDNVQGRVVILAGNGGTASPVAFRFVNAIPEPSTAALGSLGFVALAGFVFRTRLNRLRSAH